METIGQEKFITNSSVPTAEESKNNGTDEIVIEYYLNLCQAILYFIMSVIFFPLFYFWNNFIIKIWHNPFHSIFQAFSKW